MTVNDVHTNSELQKEEELDHQVKDMACHELQLEHKESANMQALLQLEVWPKTIQEFSAQLKSSKSDTENYIQEVISAHPFFESTESSAGMEKKWNDGELLKHKSELNEAILATNLASMEAEKVECDFFSGMEAELEIATTAVLHSQQQAEEMKRQLDVMKDIENELLANTIEIEYLQLELKQAKAWQHSPSSSTLSNAVNEFNKLKSKVNSEKELDSVREEVKALNRQVEVLTSEVKRMKDEMFQSSKRELELQVEIATLKAEVHKGRSRTAAAEAAEARAMSAQAGLYLAVQQLEVEAEAAKSEARRLKLEVKCNETVAVENPASDSTEFCSCITISMEEYESYKQKAEQAEELATEQAEELASLQCRDEFQQLEHGKKSEAEILREELENANTEVSELKSALEDAVRRAEMAEKVKMEIEEKLRKWRGKRQQRRAASEVRQGRSATPVGNEEFHMKLNQKRNSMCEERSLNYVPLAKILNMKF